MDECMKIELIEHVSDGVVHVLFVNIERSIQIHVNLGLEELNLLHKAKVDAIELIEDEKKNEKSKMM